MQLHVRFDIAAGPYVLSPKRGYVWRRWCFREKGYVSNFSYQFHDVPVTCEGVSGRREDFNVVDLHLSFRQILTLSCNRNSWTATLILLHWTNAGVWIHQQNKFHRIANDPFHECFNILFFNSPRTECDKFSHDSNHRFCFRSSKIQHVSGRIFRRWRSFWTISWTVFQAWNAFEYPTKTASANEIHMQRVGPVGHPLQDCHYVFPKCIHLAGLSQKFSRFRSL